MMQHRKTAFQRVCLVLGIGLLIAGAVVFFLWQRGIQTACEQTADCVMTLRDLMPQPQGAVPEERTNNAMPVLSVDGRDYIGILEIPVHDSVLPVCARWGSLSESPCLFSGSVYDRTIQIGGTSQKGQYAFFRDISVGDSLFFTDMTGNRYGYSVTDILYRKHADPETLNSRDADLTLFIQNVFGLEYILVFCAVSG